MRQAILTLVFCLVASLAHATNYYLSPIGSNANSGLTTGAPWLTFTYAQANGWGCGDTLFLVNGTFGDGTSTGKLSISSTNCSVGNEMIVRPLNVRQATISDNGTGRAITLIDVSYIIVDGLVLKSIDNNYLGNPSTNELGEGIYVGRTGSNRSHHLTIRNNLLHHNNRYGNTHLIDSEHMDDSLIEDNELYFFHRHGINLSDGNRNTVRRLYCHSRVYGSVASGFPNGFGSGGGDDCVAIYPGNDNIIENVIGEGPMAYTTSIQSPNNSDRNKVLGSISIDNFTGFNFRSRVESGATANSMPKNNILQDSVVIGSTSYSIDVRSNKGMQVNGVTIIGAGGLKVSEDPTAPGDGVTSFTSVNTLSVNNIVPGFDIVADTWTVTRSNAFNNTGGNYSPSSSANYVPSSTPSAVNPQLGTCRVWIPDASPMKGAGLNGADIGANILKRYQDGVLTAIPLWDPTTGEFPHGPIVAGLNDTASTSAYNVHVRLNVNTGGCAFPTGSGGGIPPADPAEYVSSTGTSSTSHSHTLATGMDSLTVFVHLRDGGGNVGSVSGVTACGGQALTLLKRQTSTPETYHAMEVWGKLTPTTGACTIAVSTTGTVTSIITTSIATDGVSAYGTPASAGGISATPTVTIATNTSELILAGTSAYSTAYTGTQTVTLTAGANQTLQTDTSHTTAPHRLAISTQSGNDGGVMDYVVGSTTYWAIVAVTLLPTTPDPPANPLPTLSQSHFRFHGLYGTEAAPIVQAASDTHATIVPIGMIRIRLEITANSANHSQVGLVLFCSRNGGAYAQASDSFGANVFRLYGTGANPDLPSSLAATTQQLNSGNFVAGAIVRSTTLPVLTTLNTNEHTEVEWAIALNATAGDTVACRAYQDNGSALDTYAVTPTLTVMPMAASGGR